MIFALGAGVVMYLTHLNGEKTDYQPAPEIVAYAYVPVGFNLYLRPGVRFNFSWDTSDGPTALQIHETNFRYFAELGVVYDWILMPSVSVGLGNIYRTVQFETRKPIFVPNDHISSGQSFVAMYVQGGIGFPLVKGLIVIEPYFRYTVSESGVSSGLGYGVEATFSIL